jgi:predicted P-loop ATPase
MSVADAWLDSPGDFRRKSGKSGAVIAEDLGNIRIALAKLGESLRYDAFARQALIGGLPLDDLTLDRLWVRIDDAFSFRPSKETLRTVLVDAAHRAAFHPVRDYLDRLEWDGVRRLDAWLVTYGGAEPSAYVHAVGALALIAAVRRVRQPGCKFDELLVLESGQGTLKSSALRTLCPEESWFSDDLPLGVDSKHVIERTAGKWIVEAAEMHGNRGREAEQLKTFLSRQVDGPVRLAYGRLPTSVPRQFVMIGTTNASAAYLKDSTGARRFWPVRVRRFDIDALARDLAQIWAEAATREAAGESIRLAPGLWTAAGEHQEQRRAADPWEDVLEPLLDAGDDAIRVDAVWGALGVEARWQDNRHADRVAAILQRHGYTSKRKFRPATGASPVMHWIRVPSSPEHRSE